MRLHTLPPAVAGYKVSRYSFQPFATPILAISFSHFEATRLASLMLSSLLLATSQYHN